MKPLRFLLSALLIASPLAASAADDDPAFGHVLTLVGAFTRIAASDQEPQRGFDDLLAGRNAEANRAASGLLSSMTGDLPAAQRAQVSGIATDLLAIVRKNARQAQAAPATPFPLSQPLP